MPRCQLRQLLQCRNRAFDRSSFFQGEAWPRRHGRESPSHLRQEGQVAVEATDLLGGIEFLWFLGHYFFRVVALHMWSIVHPERTDLRHGLSPADRLNGRLGGGGLGPGQVGLLVQIEEREPAANGLQVE